MNDHMRKTLEGRRLFVKNLSYDTQWKYLKDHMRQAGDVVRADVFENQYGRSRGIGYVLIHYLSTCHLLFGFAWVLANVR